MLLSWICDTADALRLPETGFFRNLSVATKDLPKKPGFSPLIQLPETGFLPNLSVATKDLPKKPGFSPLITTFKKTFDKGVDKLGNAW